MYAVSALPREPFRCVGKAAKNSTKVIGSSTVFDFAGLGGIGGLLRELLLINGSWFLVR